MEEFLEFLEANRNTGKVDIVADTRDKLHHCALVFGSPQKEPLGGHLIRMNCPSIPVAQTWWSVCINWWAKSGCLK